MKSFEFMPAIVLPFEVLRELRPQCLDHTDNLWMFIVSDARDSKGPFQKFLNDRFRNCSFQLGWGKT